MITTQTKKRFVTDDGRDFDTLALAQQHALDLLFNAPDSCWPGNFEPEHTESLLRNAAKVVDILTTKERSLARARKVNGGKKPRKPKLPAVIADSETKA